MPLTVGGGIRTIDDIRGLLNAGADKVSINTAAVKDHEFVTKAAKRLGRQCIVVAIDAKKGNNTRQYHAVGGVYPRWQDANWAGRYPVGKGGGVAGRRGDTSHQYGLRWHKKRF